MRWLVKEDARVRVTEFEELHVIKAYRNRRIGPLLISHAIQEVKVRFQSIRVKPRRIYLFVAKDNMSARNLYEQHGFQCIAEVGNLFSDEELELFYCINFS